MTERFLQKGYTTEQAKLKVVWGNPNIASICSAMPNMTILQANVAAALDKNRISRHDKRLFELYAQRTAPGYCAGCADTCEAAVDYSVPISDMMRCSMYYNGYGDRAQASALFNALPAEKKAKILGTDYSKAEKCCPQNIQIGRILRKTHHDLS
jgi:predicted aldo/keto reductase-like oxidoreductase